MIQQFKFSKKRVRANELQFKKSIVVLVSLVGKNIKNQYRRSVLGIFWTVLNPLLNMLVMSFVFTSFFNDGTIGMDYPVYIMSGNIVFALMRAATTSSLECMVNNYDLFTKTRIPYSVFPISNVLSSTVNFLFSMIALVFVMLARMSAGVTFHWEMLLIICAWLPSILLFSTGISFILSVIYVRFRDIKHLYEVFLTLWMYMTPVFYSIKSLNLKESYVKAMSFNPMLYYLQSFRSLLTGNMPSGQTFLICYGVGIGLFIVGYIIFRLSGKKLLLYI
ncbi:MAG: ABC transporter permease [Christensenellales bacterium]